MLAGGRLGRVVGLLNPGPAGLLFILLFITLLAAMGPITLRVGKLFVGPILWLYESRDYSVGLSLSGSIVPAIVTIILAWSLRRRGRRVVPAMMANEWFWVFVITYVAFLGVALPLMWPVAAAVLLSLNTPMILAAPLIFITAFGLARDVKEGGYWVAAEAYVALFITLILSDSATAVMAGVATEITHLFTKASLVIGGYGATDGLILIPIEAAIAALITVVAVRHLDALKVVFKRG
jgi:signal transduction histidine kinase